MNTSQDKWQVLWRVEGFEKSQAEELQRGMVREFGADPAAPWPVENRRKPSPPPSHNTAATRRQT